jgi:hypothetical protein
MRRRAGEPGDSAVLAAKEIPQMQPVPHRSGPRARHLLALVLVLAAASTAVSPAVAQMVITGAPPSQGFGDLRVTLVTADGEVPLARVAVSTHRGGGMALPPLNPRDTALFPGLPAGAWEIEVRAEGYPLHRVYNVWIEPGDVAHVPVWMRRDTQLVEDHHAGPPEHAYRHAFLQMEVRDAAGEVVELVAVEAAPAPSAQAGGRSDALLAALPDEARDEVRPKFASRYRMTSQGFDAAFRGLLAGQFRVNWLQPGSFDLKITGPPGSAPVLLRGVAIQAGVDTLVRVTLPEGSDQVEVSRPQVHYRPL